MVRAQPEDAVATGAGGAASVHRHVYRPRASVRWLLAGAFAAGTLALLGAGLGRFSALPSSVQAWFGVAFWLVAISAFFVEVGARRGHTRGTMIATRTTTTIAALLSLLALPLATGTHGAGAFLAWGVPALAGVAAWLPWEKRTLRAPEVLRRSALVRLLERAWATKPAALFPSLAVAFAALALGAMWLAGERVVQVHFGGIALAFVASAGFGVMAVLEATPDVTCRCGWAVDASLPFCPRCGETA